MKRIRLDRSTLRSTLRLLSYPVAFLILPVAVGAGSVAFKMSQVTVRQPPAFASVPDAVPHIEGDRLLAVILAGNAGTESTDLLAPYEVLKASGAFDVYTVARERKLVPLFPGTLDLLPDYSFDDYERLVGRRPDLLVIPYIAPNEVEDPALWQWIRSQAGDDTLVLTICGGSLVLAEAGLLAGRRATSHQGVLQVVRETHPDVQWISGERYVDDGDIVSSAGITSGIDATLHVIERMVGREVAERVAAGLGYAHVGYLDDPAFIVPPSFGLSDYIAAAFRWRQSRIGLFLDDGVGEVELAAIIDTYPRSFAAQVHTLATTRRRIVSRHGLQLVPRSGLADAPEVDRVLATRLERPAERLELTRWATDRSVPVDHLDAERFPYDAALADISADMTPATAAWTAAMLEYPAEGVATTPQHPASIFLRPAALGFIGMIAFFGIDVRRRRRGIR